MQLSLVLYVSAFSFDVVAIELDGIAARLAMDSAPSSFTSTRAECALATVVHF